MPRCVGCGYSGFKRTMEKCDCGRWVCLGNEGGLGDYPDCFIVEDTCESCR